MKTYLHYFAALLLLFTLSPSLEAQMIHDARKIREMIDEDGMLMTTKSTQSELIKLLAYNLDRPLAKSASQADVLEAYEDNPFIAPYLALVMAEEDRGVEGDGQRALGGLAGAASGLGMPGSTFIMGLTDFLVNRTKQELTIAFFKDFQKKVEESEEMRYLFPTTSAVLLQIDKDIYRFNAFWEVLRESFLTDLNDLGYHLDDFVQNSSRIKSPMQRHMMSDFFKVGELLQEQTPPAQIVSYMAEDAYLHVLTPEDDSAAFVPVMQRNLKLLGLFSKALEQKDQSGYWVTPNEVVDLVRDTTFNDIFFGLLYQKGKDYQIDEEKTLGESLLDLRGDNLKMRSLVNNLKRFADEGKNVQRIAKDIRARKNARRRAKGGATLDESEKELEFDDYYHFTQGVSNMLLEGYNFKKQLVGATTEQDSIVDRYLGIVGDLNTLGLNIRKKHYTSAVINTLVIIEKLLPQDEYACERKNLMKYGSFIATAVQAKSSKEVSQAISAFALPPGGSAIKKYSRFSVAINAYVGLSAGQEHLNGVGTSSFYSLATPVGVTFNWGFKGAGSISILASAIDLGALTTFRFEAEGEDNVSELPELKMENVFAPGAYLIYGVPKYPLSIGVGAQLGPNLREVTNASLNIDKTSGWRWGAFIAVDIPIVSLYSSNKYYKKCCKSCNQ